MPRLVPYPLLERLFEKACTNQQILISLKSLLSDLMGTRMRRFRHECNLLLENERKRLQVVACEDQFVDEICEARTTRFISALAKLEHDTPFPTSSGGPIPSILLEASKQLETFAVAARHSSDASDEPSLSKKAAAILR